VTDEDERPLAHLEPLTDKRRKLVHALVWGDGKRKTIQISQAPKAAGMSHEGARQALHDAKVQEAIRAESKVRRAVGLMGNLPALERVRDGSKNGLAVVAAVKALEMIGQQDSENAGQRATMGMVIVIPQQIAADQQIRQLAQGSAKPLICLDAVAMADEEQGEGP